MISISYLNDKKTGVPHLNLHQICKLDGLVSSYKRDLEFLGCFGHGRIALKGKNSTYSRLAPVLKTLLQQCEMTYCFKTEPSE